MPRDLVLSLDLGTSSARALLAHVRTGEELSLGVADYPSGDHGVITDAADPNLARQNPADYFLAARDAISACLANARDVRPDRVLALGVDATGSTPVPVDRTSTPLALRPEFRDDPAAMAWLWKDHTAHAEAAEITAAAASTPFLLPSNSTYSSEWYWSKVLHAERASPRVAAAAHAWVELSDLFPAFLAGIRDADAIPRNACAAGHKAMHHPAWGGPPSRDFLDALQPGLARFRTHFLAPAPTPGRPIGSLDPALARELGLPPGIPIAAGILDAHAGAIGSGCAPGTLVKIVGTSTCDCMVAPARSHEPRGIPGIAGVVPNSIIPGFDGIEAGQAAVGDLFHWFASRLGPRVPDPHAALARDAARLRPGESGLLALDWSNGNRSILADPLLTGLLIGQTLSTSPHEIYRALIEATAFGSLAIVRQLEAHADAVARVVLCGGIPEKNPLLVRIYADVLDRPIRLARSSQACALGAAILAAVAGGAHASVLDAQHAMASLRPDAIEPDPASAATYRRLAALFTRLHDAFGSTRPPQPLSGVMKELLRVRAEARAGSRG